MAENETHESNMSFSVRNNLTMFIHHQASNMNVSNELYPLQPKIRSAYEVVFKVATYSAIIALSLIGNTLVVYVVWRNHRMHTTTNYFLVNLAISDILVTICCTWVHLVDDLTEGWVLGAFFCKFNSFAQVLSLVSSILTLTLISCDRFFGIVFAMKAHISERRSTVYIVLVWICGIGISSPLLFYREQFTRQWLDHLEIWCDDTWPPTMVQDAVSRVWAVTHRSKTAYYTFVSTVLYFAPILVMTVAYTMVIWKLWSSKIPGDHIESEVRTHDKIKKKVILMLVILLSTFTICWLPFHIAIMYAEYRRDKDQQLPDWFQHFYFFANYIAFSNSAFNPIIYTGFNENFRREFRDVFRCRRMHSETNDRRRYSASITVGLRQNLSSHSFTMVTKI